MNTPPKKESNPVYDIIYQFKLLLNNRESNQQSSAVYARIILSKLRSIFGSKAVGEAFTYFCLHGASTAWVIQCRLEMTEPTAYRAMKQLRSLGVIEPALKVSKIKHSKGGPRPIVWVIQGGSPEDVADALRLHYQMLSPKYRIAENVAQTILDEFHDKGRPREISYREIIVYVKELEIPFMAPDIATMTAQYLHEKGIKVWR